MIKTPQQKKELIISKAKELGFISIGITTSQTSDRLDFFYKWIENGFNAEMTYLARPDRLKRREYLMNILENIKSVIMLCYPYSYYVERKSEQNTGFISSFALMEDYHLLIEEKLNKLSNYIKDSFNANTKSYIDSSPIFERDFASRCGLGFIGKNTMLIHNTAPCFIGEILTDLELPVDDLVMSSKCDNCTLCLKNCPTGAIKEPYLLDANKCISYLTIEHKGVIPLQLRHLLGNKIFGCDNCQIVCPFIKDIKNEIPEEYNKLYNPDLIELLSLTQEGFKKLFFKTPVIRIGIERFKRNVIVALGNIGDKTALEILKAFKQTQVSQLLNEHLIWAITEIEKKT